MWRKKKFASLCSFRVRSFVIIRTGLILQYLFSSSLGRRSEGALRPGKRERESLVMKSIANNNNNNKKLVEMTATRSISRCIHERLDDTTEAAARPVVCFEL